MANYNPNLTDGVVILTDGTRTLTLTPTAGDFAGDDAQPMEMYLNRGAIPTDGSGARLADEVPAEGTFSHMLLDDALADGVNLPTLANWWFGESSAAMTAASWASTLPNHPDVICLDVEWYPNGTATGAPIYTIPNAVLTSRPKAEGRPTVFSMSVQSITAKRAVLSYVP